MPRDMMNRSMLLAMGRVVDFLAVARPPAIEDAIHETPGEAMLPSNQAHRKLKIKAQLRALKKQVLLVLRRTFPERTFEWEDASGGNMQELLYTAARDGGDSFVAIELRYWDGNSDDVGFWFYMDCDYGIVENVMHHDIGHHMVSFEEDGPDLFWQGRVSYDSAYLNYETDMRVLDRVEAFYALEKFLVGAHAQGLNVSDDDSSAASPVTASSPRTP
jgi:hypothetical protein